MSELHVVTGAFGYSGKYITTRLLEAGVHVRTLDQFNAPRQSFRRQSRGASLQLR